VVDAGLSPRRDGCTCGEERADDRDQRRDGVRGGSGGVEPVRGTDDGAGEDDRGDSEDPFHRRGYSLVAESANRLLNHFF
jgi:hypothetical protein